MTFEEYLREKFAAQYDGLDDEMPDCEADWFGSLDAADVIQWAEAWGALKQFEGFKKAVNGYDKMMNDLNVITGRASNESHT